MTPVKSSNISHVGYDPATRAMKVQFHSGAIHQYEDVPPEHHANMTCKDCASVGSYFHKHIRGGGFKSKKVET